jgi:hypothetical protein
VLLFDGEDPDALRSPRVRWTEAKNSGFEVDLWHPTKRCALAAQGLSGVLWSVENYPHSQVEQLD